MKTNIATTLEQSARLLLCGVSADTADMMYTPHNTLSTDPYKEALNGRGYTPAWSLGALLALIPKEIRADGDDFYFSLAKEFLLTDDFLAAYKSCFHADDIEELVGKRASCPIEACVQLIEWLKDGTYKLNDSSY